jgi:hypothetical protein
MHDEIKVVSRFVSRVWPTRVPAGKATGPRIYGLRPSVIAKNLLQFKLAQVFTEAEVAHWFLRKPTIVGSIIGRPKPELEGELGPEPTGKKLIASKPKFGKIRIISESLSGSYIAMIRTDVPANFLSRNGRLTMAGCCQQSQ